MKKFVIADKSQFINDTLKRDSQFWKVDEGTDDVADIANANRTQMNSLPISRKSYRATIRKRNVYVRRRKLPPRLWPRDGGPRYLNLLYHG